MGLGVGLFMGIVMGLMVGLVWPVLVGFMARHRPCNFGHMGLVLGLVLDLAINAVLVVGLLGSLPIAMVGVLIMGRQFLKPKGLE